MGHFYLQLICTKLCNLLSFLRQVYFVKFVKADCAPGMEVNRYFLEMILVYSFRFSAPELYLSLYFGMLNLYGRLLLCIYAAI